MWTWNNVLAHDIAVPATRELTTSTLSPDTHATNFGLATSTMFVSPFSHLLQSYRTPTSPEFVTLPVAPVAANINGIESSTRDCTNTTCGNTLDQHRESETTKQSAKPKPSPVIQSFSDKTLPPLLQLSNTHQETAINQATPPSCYLSLPVASHHSMTKPRKRNVCPSCHQELPRRVTTRKASGYHDCKCCGYVYPDPEFSCRGSNRRCNYCRIPPIRFVQSQPSQNHSLIKSQSISTTLVSTPVPASQKSSVESAATSKIECIVCSQWLPVTRFRSSEAPHNPLHTQFRTCRDCEHSTAASSDVLNDAFVIPRKPRTTESSHVVVDIKRKAATTKQQNLSLVKRQRTTMLYSYTPRFSCTYENEYETMASATEDVFIPNSPRSESVIENASTRMHEQQLKANCTKIQRGPNIPPPTSSNLEVSADPQTNTASNKQSKANPKKVQHGVNVLTTPMSGNHETSDQSDQVSVELKMYSVYKEVVELVGSVRDEVYRQHGVYLEHHPAVQEVRQRWETPPTPTPKTRCKRKKEARKVIVDDEMELYRMTVHVFVQLFTRYDVSISDIVSDEAASYKPDQKLQELLDQSEFLEIPLPIGTFINKNKEILMAWEEVLKVAKFTRRRVREQWGINIFRHPAMVQMAIRSKACFTHRRRNRERKKELMTLFGPSVLQNQRHVVELQQMVIYVYGILLRRYGIDLSQRVCQKVDQYVPEEWLATLLDSVFEGRKEMDLELEDGQVMDNDDSPGAVVDISTLQVETLGLINAYHQLVREKYNVDLRKHPIVQEIYKRRKGCAQLQQSTFAKTTVSVLLPLLKQYHIPMSRALETVNINIPLDETMCTLISEAQ